MDVIPLGDNALLIQLGEAITEDTHLRVRAVADALDNAKLDGVLEIVAAFTSVAVHYDPLRLGAELGSFDQLRGRVRAIAQSARASKIGEGPLVDVPVSYGGEFGPDLPALAERAGLTEAAFIEAHAAATYTVYMIGFSAGFPYLSGLPQRLASPRHATPRATVPAGSVGIAGNQCGIYPFSTPGGWQLIGRTPLRIFEPAASPPALFSPGVRVRFVPTAADALPAELLR